MFSRAFDGKEKQQIFSKQPFSSSIYCEVNAFFVMASNKASVFTEEEGNNSNANGHRIALDVWLSINRITKVEEVQSIFEERQITVEELLELDESDIRALCQELGFDTLTKARILSGIKNTLKDSAMAAPAAPVASAPNSSMKSNGISDMMYGMEMDHIIPIHNDQIPGNVDNSDIPDISDINPNAQHVPQRIIISPEEHNAMDKLQRRQAIVSSLTTSIQESQGMIDIAAERAQRDLQETFTLLFEQMKLRQEEMQSMLEEVALNKKKALNQQLEKLETYKVQIATVNMI